MDKVNISNIKIAYFIGIGGIGMSAIARFLKDKGVEIYGYDKTKTKLTSLLEQEGMHIHYNDDVNAIPENLDVAIYTPAVPNDLNELLYIAKSKTPLIKRSKMLRYITENRTTISVAGTHGKTSVSSILSHILYQSEKKCNAFLGGIVKNYNSNVLISQKSNLFVVEADEYDKSFLNLFSTIAIITYIDADHLDVYGNIENLKNTFSDFALNIKDNGCLLIRKGVELNCNLNPTVKKYTYSVNEKADFYIDNIKNNNGNKTFDIKTPNATIHNVMLGVKGSFNIENALAAASAAYIAGASANEIRYGLGSFMGVARRFDVHIFSPEIIYIDDYAHHPRELKACINAAKELDINRKITGIFQPHLYSRTRDFAIDFAEALSLLDVAILLNIYPAREKPIEGVNSNALLSMINCSEKKLFNNEQLINYLKNAKPQTLITMGAGNIDLLVDNIIEILKK